MADLEVATQALQWGRLPDGRFFVDIVLPVPAAAGKVVRVPLARFVLTKEEEQFLKASLSGLQIATTLNGGANHV